MTSVGSMMDRARKNLYWLYIQYSLMSTTYVMEPFEAVLFNVTVITVLITAICSAYVYLPQQMLRIFAWFQLAFLELSNSTNISNPSLLNVLNQPMVTTSEF